MSKATVSLLLILRGIAIFVFFSLAIFNGIFLGVTRANGFKEEGGKYYTSYDSKKKEVDSQQYYRLKTISDWMWRGIWVSLAALLISTHILEQGGIINKGREMIKKDEGQA